MAVVVLRRAFLCGGLQGDCGICDWESSRCEAVPVLRRACRGVEIEGCVPSGPHAYRLYRYITVVHGGGRRLGSF